MGKLKAWISEWARDCVYDMHRSEYAGINVVERLLRDPGICHRAEHRVLWWPRTRKIAAVSRAAHQLTPVERIILIVHYGDIIKDDGRRFTKRDLVKNSSLTGDQYDEVRREAEATLRRILKI